MASSGFRLQVELFFVFFIVFSSQISGIKGNSVVVFGAEINIIWAALHSTTRVVVVVAVAVVMVIVVGANN